MGRKNPPYRGHAARASLGGALPSCAGDCCAMLLPTALVGHADAQVLNAQKLLDAQTFWDNRDWDWYGEHPVLRVARCRHQHDLLLPLGAGHQASHLRLARISGYSFTEFIDRPFWSGAYGAISCPAGHQLYEVALAARPRYRPRLRALLVPHAGRAAATLQHLARRCRLGRASGASRRRTSSTTCCRTWSKNYEGWEKRHFVPEVGLFWQTGHDDGMEYQHQQPADAGHRPRRARLSADAQRLPVGRCAGHRPRRRLAGDADRCREVSRESSRRSKSTCKKSSGTASASSSSTCPSTTKSATATVKARTLTYQTGQFAGSPHGRELIGYVPWQFNLPDAGYEVGVEVPDGPRLFLRRVRPDDRRAERPDVPAHQNAAAGGAASRGPTPPRRRSRRWRTCLQNYEQNVVTKADYVKLLRTYAQHASQGRPAVHRRGAPIPTPARGRATTPTTTASITSTPATTILIITGLVGLRPRDDDMIEVQPLAPDDWDYFALDDVRLSRPPRGDRLGSRRQTLWQRRRLARSSSMARRSRQVAKLDSLDRHDASLERGGGRFRLVRQLRREQ